MYCLLITRSNDRFSSGLSPVFFLDAPFPRLRFRQRAEELGEYRGLRETQLGGDLGDAHVRPLHQLLSFEEKVAVAPFHRRHAADGEDGAPELAGLELHYAGVFAGVHPAVLADEIGEEIDQVVARGAVASKSGGTPIQSSSSVGLRLKTVIKTSSGGILLNVSSMMICFKVVFSQGFDLAILPGQIYGL